MQVPDAELGRTPRQASSPYVRQALRRYPRTAVGDTHPPRACGEQRSRAFLEGKSRRAPPPSFLCPCGVRSWRVESVMYAVVRVYQVDPARLREIDEIVRERFLPVIGRIPGLVSFCGIEAGHGKWLAVTVFES